MNEYKKYVQRIGLTGITNVLLALSSLILLPILTKNLSIVDYGIWVQICTTIGLITIFSTLGLTYTMVRYLSAQKDKIKIQEDFYSILVTVLIFNVIIALTLLFFSKELSIALFNGDINIIILLALTVFFISLNGLLNNYFRTFNQIKRFSTFLLTQTYLGILIISYSVINGFGIYYALFGYLIANLITFSIMFSFIVSNIGIKIPKFNRIKEYLLFGIPLIPSNLSYWIVDSIDRYVIGILLGLVYVGYYNPGYTLGNIIIMILSPFTLLLPSILPKYYDENNYEKVRIYLKFSIKYFLLIAIPAAFGLSILSKPILVILTNLEIANNGYIITPFIAFGILLFGIYGIINNILVLKKKTNLLGLIWIVAAFVNLILNLIIVPMMGILGAAIATFIAYCIALILTHKYSNKFIKIDYDVPFLIKSFTASILMSIIIIIINPEGISSILTTVILSIIIYLILILIFKGIDNREIQFIRELFNLN